MKTSELEVKPVENSKSSHIFKVGDSVNFIDKKDRYTFAALEEGGVTQIRGDRLSHDQVIGQHDGAQVESNRGHRFDVFKPTLVEAVLKMPRAATIIYPKDLGMVLTWGDIYPGATVVEAGIGSGAMAINLLRAIGPSGKLISYELREDFKNRATKNVKAFFGDAPNHEIKQGDIYQGIEEREVDRLVLDVPEPWQVVPHAVEFLRPGGIFVSYSPTIIQVKETVDNLNRTRAFAPTETLEAIVRPWNVSGRSVRPELHMVGHTGFLTFARKRGVSQRREEDGDTSEE